ncbi:DNA-binding response regulator [Paenibacillus ginsengarvi]|uniref:DNA-binding response regulator n=1 Tax=Paenibacillus ginsengarvi TaxID=400777 RepID=A0A3B0AYL4_9BACL|nr:response regulator transcription factor [Paenibacillus ginsengarvi]RKN65500.1 DNA-binding response regulator [Paenibacillus ginsengarvi]
MKLLVAEDDPSVCEMLRLFLHKENIQAVFVHDGNEAEKQLRENVWDFVLLDWMLPGRNGLDLCAEFRKRSDTPIIILTARTDEKDRIAGLELGADDYVTKPFSPLELMARIKAVKRRYTPSPSVPTDTPEAVAKPSSRLKHMNMCIDTVSREVTIYGRTVTALTPKEFDLLLLFISHPKQVFTREQLIEAVWGFDYYGEDRTVDVHIKRLRNKISTAERQWIMTVWGVGYKLED